MGVAAGIGGECVSLIPGCQAAAIPITAAVAGGGTLVTDGLSKVYQGGKNLDDAMQMSSNNPSDSGITLQRLILCPMVNMWIQ